MTLQTGKKVAGGKNQPGRPFSLRGNASKGLSADDSCKAFAERFERRGCRTESKRILGCDATDRKPNRKSGGASGADEGASLDDDAHFLGCSNCGHCRCVRGVPSLLGVAASEGDHCFKNRRDGNTVARTAPARPIAKIITVARSHFSSHAKAGV